jgi:hypothetical protein
VNVIRHPSITSAGTLEPGSLLTLTVDLLLEDTDRETESAGVVIQGLPPDWTQVPVQVRVMSSHLFFTEGQESGTVIIRRDQASIPCALNCTVGKDLVEGDAIEIIATFSHGNRFCGFARRLLRGSGSDRSEETRGTVSVEFGVASPDLTVAIFHPQRSAEGCFAWHVDPRQRFDGLPGRLQGEIDLGEGPEAYARSLFAQCAGLESGKHMDALEGMGETLWDRAPDCFKSVYWAMRKEYGTDFSIQFISDDPYIPWELMRPYNEDEALDLLAAMHPVARWIAAYEGQLRNRLPTGLIFTIAPNYTGNVRALPDAQVESSELELARGAFRIPGKRNIVLRILHEGLERETVAVVHFAGHGKFGIDYADQSLIHLEDGTLSVTEVSNQRVKLGEKCRTLVIFNACEIGATGSVLGMVGGWAEAFIRRKFSGFIAPLWAVIDKDAAVVISELLEAVWVDKETMGVALKNIRAKHGKRSPTFFSYLFYGDVMARVAAVEM